MPRGRKPRNPIIADLQGAPTKPGYLDELASEEWDRIVPILRQTGNLSLADGSALALYCQAFSRWVQSEEGLATDGFITLANNGIKMKSPWVDIGKQAEATMIKLLTQFGLTPKARNALKQQEVEPEDDEGFGDILAA